MYKRRPKCVSVLVFVFALLLFSSVKINTASAIANVFTDIGDIANLDAVRILTNFNVISGYPDGSFQPKKTISRSEFCKIIYIALNGGVDFVGSQNAMSPFSDTEGHWASAYIAYCAERNIVNGDMGLGGPFRPDDNVTVGEAAKALLITIGYKADVAGFMGDDWLYQVSFAINDCDPKLLEQVDSKLEDQLTRERACQMLWNTLRTDMVTYEQAYISDGKGGLTLHYTLIKDTYRSGGTDIVHTLLSRAFGVVRMIGVVVENEHASLVTPGKTLQSGTTRLHIRSSSSLGTWNASNDLFYFSSEMDLLGQEIEIYAKVQDGKNIIYGSPLVTSQNVICKIPAEANIYNTAAASGIQIQTNSLEPTIVFENLTVKSNFYNYFMAYSDANSYEPKDVKAPSGMEIKVIDNNKDGYADYIFVMRPSLEKLEKVDANGSITLSSSPSTLIYARDIVTKENLQAQQLYSVTSIAGKYYIEKAKYVSGEVTRIGDGGKSLMLSDGKNYYRSYLYDFAGLDESVVSKSQENGTVRYTQKLFVSGSMPSLQQAVVEFGKEYVFYLDTHDNIIGYTQRSGNVSQYILVTESGYRNGPLGSGTIYEIYGYLSDGTPGAVYQVNMDSKLSGAISRYDGDSLIAWDHVFQTKSKSLLQGLTSTKADAPVLARYKKESNGTITLFNPVQVTDWRVSADATGTIPYLYTEGEVANHSNLLLRKGQTTIKYMEAPIDRVFSGGYFGNNYAQNIAILNSHTVVFQLTRDMSRVSNGTSGAYNVLDAYTLSAITLGASTIPEVKTNQMSTGAVLLNESGTAGAVAIITTGNVSKDTYDYVYLWSKQPNSVNSDGSYTYEVIQTNGKSTYIETKYKYDPGFYSVRSESQNIVSLSPVSNHDTVTAITNAAVQYAQNGTVVLYNDGKGVQSGKYTDMDSASYTDQLPIFRVTGKGVESDGVFTNTHGAKGNVHLLVDENNTIIIAVSDISVSSEKTYYVHTKTPFQYQGDYTIYADISMDGVTGKNVVPGEVVSFYVAFENKAIGSSDGQDMFDYYVSFHAVPDNSSTEQPNISAVLPSSFAVDNRFHLPDRLAGEMLGSNVAASFYFKMPSDNVTITFDSNF